jgi:RHS repeat-associated protein
VSSLSTIRLCNRERGQQPWEPVPVYGREYLFTFGLYDYRHRIYHPGLGRFIETDPLGQQIEGAKLSAEQEALYPEGGAPAKFSSSELNLYRYCHNNPVNRSDPLGLETAVAIGGTRDDWTVVPNVLGHVSMAMTGQGTFSFGTGTAQGSSFTAFLTDQTPDRFTNVYVLHTSEGQEKDMKQSLEASVKKGALPNVFRNPVDAHNDNCTTRTADALRAGGQDVGHPKTPAQLQATLDKKVYDGTATRTLIPQSNKPSIPIVLKDFDKK